MWSWGFSHKAPSTNLQTILHEVYTTIPAFIKNYGNVVSKSLLRSSELVS